MSRHDLQTTAQEAALQALVDQAQELDMGYGPRQTTDFRTEPDATNPWRETVRDIFDMLHHGEDDIFTGNQLARRLVALIEDRHHDFFCEEAESDGQQS